MCVYKRLKLNLRNKAKDNIYVCVKTVANWLVLVPQIFDRRAKGKYYLLVVTPKGSRVKC